MVVDFENFWDENFRVHAYTWVISSNSSFRLRLFSTPELINSGEDQTGNPAVLHKNDPGIHNRDFWQRLQDTIFTLFEGEGKVTE